MAFSSTSSCLLSALGMCISRVSRREANAFRICTDRAQADRYRQIYLSSDSYWSRHVRQTSRHTRVEIHVKTNSAPDLVNRLTEALHVTATRLDAQRRQRRQPQRKANETRCQPLVRERGHQRAKEHTHTHAHSKCIEPRHPKNASTKSKIESLLFPYPEAK